VLICGQTLSDREQKKTSVDINKTINFIREIFNTKDFIPLHTPTFGGNEKKYLNECIDSTFVSSVGKFVDQFEEQLAKYTGAKYAVACVNGTNALHMGMLVVGVKEEDEVITQALSFVATANAISYLRASPVFVDVDRDTLSLSPDALQQFLNKNAELKSDGFTYNKNTGKRISACIPMHTFGLPARIDEIKEICEKWNISLIEDAAESLGSLYKGKHTGTFGKMGTFSFNGNKTITCGGGGALITNDEQLAVKAKHLTTQAKVPHKWKFEHDEIGYNYRMPNLNAALACAQLERLDEILQNKRELAEKYALFFVDSNIQFIGEPDNSRSNYWLNALLLNSKEEREQFLEKTNTNGVMTRPIWELMTTLRMFEHCQHDGLKNSKWLAERVVNIPSSYRENG
jgi:aminotransferase in exopolysaccharide biosynthesis